MHMKLLKGCIVSEKLQLEGLSTRVSSDNAYVYVQQVNLKLHKTSYSTHTHTHLPWFKCNNHIMRSLFEIYREIFL